VEIEVRIENAEATSRYFHSGSKATLRLDIPSNLP
jgi:hypothetical protein